MQTVGIYGYVLSDPRISRIRNAGIQEIVWIVNYDQPQLVDNLIRMARGLPDILVVNPRWKERIARLLKDLPATVKVVDTAQPFGEETVNT